MFWLRNNKINFPLRNLILEVAHGKQLNNNTLSNVLKETKSATMNIFRFFYFVFKSFVKVELSYVFTINLFTIAEN